jgi:hypothetical protein
MGETGILECIANESPLQVVSPARTPDILFFLTNMIGS